MNKFIAIGCLGALALGVVIVIAAAMFSYNGLVSKSQAVDSQWAQVQNVYQRRADLVPNLVKTVSAAADFEKSTLTQVADARASVGRVTIDASRAPQDAKTLQEFQQAQGQLATALSRMLAVSEQYPQLRATEGFRTLLAQLEGSENRISVERERFNEVVRTYNTAVQSFPNVLYARSMGFAPKPYFTATETAQTAPSVDFPSFKK